MGANAQTTVPTFTAGQVLTAAQLNNSARTGVPVFAGTTERDAAFGGAGEKTLAEGQLCYLESTNKVQYYDGAAWANLGSMTNVDAFTATNASYVVPAGVTYMIAHIRGGGGGIGRSAVGGAGGTSSVAFAGGTVSATGGPGVAVGMGVPDAVFAYTPQANSGLGGYMSLDEQGTGSGNTGQAFEGAYIVAGGAVTAGATLAVTVGAGGTAGANSGVAGASGYVWIEYQV